MSTQPPSTTVSRTANSPRDTLGPGFSKEQLPVVELTDADLERARAVAGAWNESYEPIDGGTIYGDDSSVETLDKGVRGELAIAKYYGLEMQDEALWEGDDGYDFVINNMRVDIKSVSEDVPQTGEDLALLVPERQHHNADVYLLVDFETERRTRIYGFAPSHVVFDRPPREYPAYTRNYVVDAAELTPPPAPDCVR